MATDTLETVAGKINALTEKMGKAEKDVRQYRATRNQLIEEAHDRVINDEDQTWETWVEANLTITRQAVAKILKLAKPQNISGQPVVQENLVEGPEEPPQPTKSQEERFFVMFLQFTLVEQARVLKRCLAEHKASGGLIDDPWAPIATDTLNIRHSSGDVSSLTFKAYEKNPPKFQGGENLVEWVEEPGVQHKKPSEAIKALVSRVNDCSTKREWIIQRMKDGLNQVWSAAARGVHTQIVDDFYAMDAEDQATVLHLLRDKSP